MKYTFESYEISSCWLCPLGKVIDIDESMYCRLTGRFSDDGTKPKNCPLTESKSVEISTSKL
jgi:hypothetical protein